MLFKKKLKIRYFSCEIAREHFRPRTTQIRCKGSQTNCEERARATASKSMLGTTRSSPSVPLPLPSPPLLLSAAATPAVFSLFGNLSSDSVQLSSVALLDRVV